MARLPKPRRGRLSPAELLRRAQAQAERRKWEDLLDFHVRAWQLPPATPEYRFSESRDWRFDRAWPEFKVAVEIEGLVPHWKLAGGGHHQRPAGYARDCEKYNAAQAQGWTLLRFTPIQVKAGYAIREIEAALHRAAFGGRER